MKTKFFLLLFAYMASSMIFATDVFDFTTMNLSQSDLAITNGSVSYNSSKGYYEVSNNENDTMSMTINGVPNVVFKYWAETSKKAFKVKPNEYIQLDGSTRTLRICNLNVNDIVTLRVASKGPSAANSFSGGLTNCTLESGNLTQAEYDYPFVYEDVSFKATASTIEITNTAGGYCLTTISIERSQSSDPQHSGTCGLSTTWRLSNDTLYLDGNGEVYGGYRGNLWWGDFDNSKLIQITTLVIGENITFLGNQLCYGMNNLRSIVLNAKYCGMNSWSRSSAAPDGNGPFYAYAEFDITGQIQEVTIGNNVDTLFCRFFEGMSAIKNIHYYATNAYYKDYNYNRNTPFYEASGISYIEIGENVQKLYPFNNWKENSDSTIIQYNAIDLQLEDRLISDPSKVKSIILGNKVKNIPNGFASSCSNVKSIILPNNSIQSIGKSAFNGCSGLTSVEIPNSVTSIGESAFYGCSGLTSVTIGNSVTSIGESAFYGCKSLTSITIPNSVTSIGSEAFVNCSGLTSISVESGNTHYDSRNNCNAIIETSTNTLIAGCKNTIIPNGVTSIGDYAFYGCSGLTSVTIGNSVTSIGRSAFYYCSGLRSVVLGSSLRVIEDGGFYACDSIESFTCYSVRPPSVVESGYTYRLPYSTIVYAPAESLSAYQAHDFWGRYDVRPLENSALEDIFAEHTIVELLANPATQVFTLQGNDVSTQRANLPTGTYILRLGNKAGKVVIP